MDKVGVGIAFLLFTCHSKGPFRLLLSSSSDNKVLCLTIGNAPCEQFSQGDMKMMMIRGGKIVVSFKKVFCQDIVVKERNCLLLSRFADFV